MRASRSSGSFTVVRFMVCQHTTSSGRCGQPSAAAGGGGPGGPGRVAAVVEGLEVLQVLQGVQGGPEALVAVGDQLAVSHQPLERLLHQVLPLADVVEDRPPEEEAPTVDAQVGALDVADPGDHAVGL